jgi:Kef-type K+ transport system membrane component KefB
VIVRLAAMALLASLMLVLQYVAEPDVVSSYRAISLAVGFALLAAIVLGDVVERVGLPRLTGYLLFGLVCGPYALRLITPTMASQLQIVNGLAVALIAFMAGLELNFGRLKSRLTLFAAYGGTIIAVAFAGLFVVIVASWTWLPIAPEITGTNRLALSLVLTTLLVSFSPTVTIAVITESRARGPLSELVLALVVLGDLALIVIFTLAMQFARTATGGALDDVDLFARLAWEIFGSVAFGALIGAGFALYLRAVGRELTVVLLAVCVLITGTARWLHFESLLVALAAGVVVENIAPLRGDKLRDAVENGALPVLVVFFVGAGAALHLDALRVLGPIAVLLAVVRFMWIRLASSVAARVTHLEDALAKRAWKGLISQAGVTLGLTTIVAAEFPGWGTAAQTLMVAMIAIHEVAGPVLFRAALADAGEIGRFDAEHAPQLDELSTRDVVT